MWDRLPFVSTLTCRHQAWRSRLAVKLDAHVSHSSSFFFVSWTAPLCKDQGLLKRGSWTKWWALFHDQNWRNNGITSALWAMTLHFGVIVHSFSSPEEGNNQRHTAINGCACVCDIIARLTLASRSQGVNSCLLIGGIGLRKTYFFVRLWDSRKQTWCGLTEVSKKRWLRVRFNEHATTWLIPRTSTLHTTTLRSTFYSFYNNTNTLIQRIFPTRLGF